MKRLLVFPGSSRKPLWAARDVRALRAVRLGARPRTSLVSESHSLPRYPGAQKLFGLLKPISVQVNTNVFS
jgi:hypothetical protein